MSDTFFYGGQAVLEGVMMRGRTAYAIATRSPSSGITVSEHPAMPWTRRVRWLGWPFVRGSVAMAESLVIGYRALNDSANRLMQELDGAEEGDGAGDQRQPAWTWVMQAGSVVLAAVVSVGLFVMLPAAVARLLQSQALPSVAVNLAEGLVKAFVFIAYVWGIGYVPDMGRVYQYHGAEHKTINCYESGQELTVGNVRVASRIHPRCGTNFLFLVVLVSVVLFSLVTLFAGRPAFVERVLLHLAILPLVAGVAYELIRAAGKPGGPRLAKVLARPGMWLQLLTTREPDASQIEVAMAALRTVLETDRPVASKPSEITVA